MSRRSRNELRPPSKPPRVHRRGYPMRSLAVLPTLFTLGNLIAGFAAIHYASKPIGTDMPWGWSTITFAGVLIFLGMFLDGVDGSIARLTRSSSNFGQMLDSLADLVTFGVAPAYLTLRLVSQYWYWEDGGQPDAIIGPEADHMFAKVLWAIAAAYVCCAALRLARFNVETSSASVRDQMVFRGLPSPGAAGAVASLILLHQHWLAVRFGDDVPVAALARATAFGMTFILLLCAFGMVSSIPYVHVMNRYVQTRASFAYVVRVVLIGILAVFRPWEMLAIGFTCYAVSGPAFLGWLIVRKRRRGRSLSPHPRPPEKIGA